MALKKMALLTLFALIFICLYAVSISVAAVYKVGDSAGWTVDQNIDYNHWAVNKKFYTGDTLLFEYNPEYHDVLMVNYGDFDSCNTKFPVQSYNSGNDSITLQSPGQFFFICGFSGHCLAGQKFHVQVTAV